jgi:DNA-binding MarR family transcriptional regulator
MHTFWRLRQVLFARVSPVLRAAHDLEMAEVFLLEYIGRSDLSPSEIAGALHLPAHAISRKLDALEKRGLIRRSLDPHDARRRVLELTPSGETLLKEAARTLEEQVASLLDVLTPDTLSTMLGTMEQLTEGSNTPPHTERP